MNYLTRIFAHSRNCRPCFSRDFRWLARFVTLSNPPLPPVPAAQRPPFSHSRYSSYLFSLVTYMAMKF